MLYKKINVELVVVADEAEAVVSELNTRSIAWKRSTHFSAEESRLSPLSTGDKKEIGARAYLGRRRNGRGCRQGCT